MTKIKLFTAALFLFLGVAMVSFAKDKPKVKEVVYKCEIDCHTCEKKIKDNIPYEKGVKSLKVDLDKQLVTIKYREDKNTDEGLEAAIEKLGYDTILQSSKVVEK